MTKKAKKQKNKKKNPTIKPETVHACLCGASGSQVRFELLLRW